MPAVMEDLDNIFIAKHISEQLFGQFKCLYISIQIHLINIDQKSICTVVELDHFDVTVLSQSAFNVYSQNATIVN